MGQQKSKTQLGKILLKRKLVNSSELDNILKEQQASSPHDTRLASKVLERGLTDEEKLLKALSEQSGVPAIDLEKIHISLDLLDIVPFEIASQHSILPISVAEGSITLAMANPDEQRVIEEIEFVSGKKVFAHVALHSKLEEVIKECYVLKKSGKTDYVGRLYNKNEDDSQAEISPNAIVVEPTDTSNVPMPIEIDIEIATDDFGSVEPSIGPGGSEMSEPSSLIPESVISKADAAAAEMPKKKVLVVDDEDDIRLLISRVLTEKGYSVVTAGRGLEAVKMVQTERPDMIILDAMLPEVHGFDICKKIKGSKKYGHIPVIMISAIYRGWRYAQDLKDSYGVDEFVEKPFKIGEFVKKVDSYFTGENARVVTVEEDLSDKAENSLTRSIRAYQAGDINRAIEIIKDGLKIDPLAYKLHYNLALLLGKKSLTYQAIRELESTLELAPGFFSALKNLALLYQKAGFKFKAIETWERALHYCPDEDTRNSIKKHLMSLL